MCYYPFGMYITTTGVEIKIKKNLFRVKNIILTGVHRIRFKDKKKRNIICIFKYNRYRFFVHRFFQIFTY